MDTRKTLHSLAELSGLLPGVEHQTPGKTVVPGDIPFDGKGKTIRVAVDKKGRKGKTVTIVDGLQHNPETLETIARILKQHCGAGGTVKEGAIEIQGNNLARVKEKLRALNFDVT